MTRYDPHPQAHDDARSTPSGFTDRRESDEKGSGVPEEGGGLREALEALAVSFDASADNLSRAVRNQRPEPARRLSREWSQRAEAWRLAAHGLREVLAAHPADAPGEDPGSRADLVARAAEVLRESPAASPGGKAWALSDAGLLVDPTERMLDAAHPAPEPADPGARQFAVDLEAEIEHLRAEVRGWQRGATAERKQRENYLDRANRYAERLNAAEARARRAEDALRAVRVEVAATRRRLFKSVEGLHVTNIMDAFCERLDQSLSGADQASDATPSDGGE